MSHINIFGSQTQLPGDTCIIIGELQTVQEKYPKLSWSCQNKSLSTWVSAGCLHVSESTRLDLPKLLLLVILETTLKDDKNFPIPLTLYLPNHMPALKASEIEKKIWTNSGEHKPHLLHWLWSKKKKKEQKALYPLLLLTEHQ